MATTIGVDVLLEEPELLAGERVGLITNQTGVTADLRYSRVELLDAGLDLRTLFSPEHGIWGIEDAGEAIDEYVDDLTGLPGRSLIGDRHAPTPEMLSDLDALVFDLQDIGVRCWTFATTMIKCLRAAAENDCRFVVLDRPDPIAGAPLEGAVMPAARSSFVGVEGLPLVYGLTSGELAMYANEEFDIGAELNVVELRDWERTWYDETDLAWLPSIPPLSGLEKALVYPATVFLEGTNVTPGWGTGRGPTLAGAPWLDRERTVSLARERIADAGLSGVGIRQDRFRPGHGVIPQYVDETCEGLQIHVTDRDAFSPHATGLCILSAIHDANDAFEWTKSETEHGQQYWTDVLGGTSDYRELISESAPVESILAVGNRGLDDYCRRRERYLLY